MKSENESQDKRNIPSKADDGGPRHQEKIPDTLEERPGWCWSRKLISRTVHAAGPLQAFISALSSLRDMQCDPQ